MEKHYKIAVPITVLVTGMVVMIFELVGIRVLAPYFGSGIDVWSVLIGLILGSLSCGYIIGGMLADRHNSYDFLGWLTSLSALCIILMNISRDEVLSMIFRWGLDLRLLVILSTSVLFLLPSFILGMIQPYCLKLSLKYITQAGSVSGFISMLSTAGGIVGTFLAGFVLIPYLGTNSILISLSAAMLALSFAYPRLLLFKVFVGVVIVLVSSGFFLTGKSMDVIADIDTLYSRVLIKESIINDRKVRLMTFGPFGFQSGIYLDDPNELLSNYFRAYDTATSLYPEASKTLMLGGGGYVFAEYFGNNYPDRFMDVVEIDPALDSIAAEYLDFQKPDNVRSFEEDGRRFLVRSDSIYDIVYMDAYSGAMNIPFHLTTLEFLQSLRSRLHTDSLVMANIIGASQGVNSVLTKRIIRTYAEVFNTVLLYAIADTSPNSIQNMLLIATDRTVSDLNFSSTKELRNLQIGILDINYEDSLLLTDNKAPVDFLNQSVRNFIRGS